MTEMNYTHNSYETRNQECTPAEYNPGYQMHNDPSWIVSAQTREGYEQVARQAEIATDSDAEIKKQAYALRYAQFSQNEWLAKSRQERVAFKLNEQRLTGIEREAKERRAQKPAPQMVKCACGHAVEAHLVMNASRGTSCPDCYDRMSE